MEGKIFANPNVIYIYYYYDDGVRGSGGGGVCVQHFGKLQEIGTESVKCTQLPITMTTRRQRNHLLALNN